MFPKINKKKFWSGNRSLNLKILNYLKKKIRIAHCLKGHNQMWHHLLSKNIKVF